MSPVGTKNEAREVYKASNVADQDSSKQSSFLGKDRERKIVKTRCIETKEREGVTQLLTYNDNYI